MDATLLADVTARLEAEQSLADEVALLALAALTGELTAYLDDGTAPTPPEAASSQPPEPARAYVQSIKVRGFRGVGPEAKLDLTPGPGLTLVIGRNGSGKSSFAEALELLLTGDNKRWSDRKNKLWKDGWRNLHDGATTEIAAELLISEIPGETRVRRSWSAEDALTAGASEVLRPGAKAEPLTSLGWTLPINSYRPFLSYNELGSMLEEGPSKLHDALGSILGLDDLGTVAGDLADARKARSSQHKLTLEAHARLVTELQTVDDERATRCVEALKPRKWDLDTVESLVTGEPSSGPGESEIAKLRELVRVRAPSLEQVSTAAAALVEACAARDELAGTDADRAQRLSTLLERAVAWHTHEGDGDCPVCGAAGKLDAAWHEQASTELTRLRDEAAQVKAAHERQVTCDNTVRTLLRPPPPPLNGETVAGIDTAPAHEAWTAWNRLANLNGRELAAAVETAAVTLDETVSALQAAAEADLDQREETWRPVARRLTAWLAGARRVQDEADLVKQLKKAEDWLRATETTIRNERFQPIKDEVKAHWSQLRSQSSVELEDITFTGKTTNRALQLDVTVDGKRGAALGVMSQGELHSLALSLFLPRATLAMSPFRFIFIDDPVQAMDPARVDGLARVLERVAKDRQVVVFTHDDRLPASVRRLGIEATHIEVQRRAGSAVEVRPVGGPIEGHIADARTLAKTSDLPRAVAERVIPGLCRQAIEAACVMAFRRRRLTKGMEHDAIEDALTGARTLLQRLALALHDDVERAGDVMATVNRNVGSWAGDVIKACNKGSHGELIGDTDAFVRDAKRLAQRLQQV